MSRFRTAVLVVCLIGGMTPALATTLSSEPAAALTPSSGGFTIGNPELAQITSGGGALQAPWNEYQGDSESQPYTSNGVGTIYPTYTPGGTTAGTSSSGSAEPNLAVFPGASAGTVSSATPYAAGVVGTPGTLDDYCGTGSNATEGAVTPSSTSVSRQPSGTTLPLAPAYFPHIVANADGSLTGYFDYRPK
ncbi:MAG: hypothetical protein WCA31_02850, partial [Acidimicrobiales bacterium]